jgi:hypothetical protein
VNTSGCICHGAEAGHSLESVAVQSVTVMEWLSAVVRRPTGMQIVAPRFGEPLIRSLASLIQRHSGVGWPPTALVDYKIQDP